MLQRISTFKSVTFFQLANQVWRKVSSHWNKKKHRLIHVFPFEPPFSQNLRQENMFFYVSQVRLGTLILCVHSFNPYFKY